MVTRGYSRMLEPREQLNKGAQFIYFNNKDFTVIEIGQIRERTGLLTRELNHGHTRYSRTFKPLEPWPHEVQPDFQTT